MEDMSEPQHYLACGNGRIIQLPYDRYVIFGRADNCTIRFSDPRISRQHAELFWNGQAFCLQDLQSSNGTWLRAMRITEPTELHNGDSFRIGPRQFLYRKINSSSELNRLQKEAKQMNGHTDTESLHGVTTDLDHDFTGSLSSMSATDLLQMFNMTKRSGLLILQTDTSKAMLYMHHGEVMEAEVYRGRDEALTGDEAVLLAARFTAGSFHFKPSVTGSNDNVISPLSHLLLEAARLSDEETTMPPTIGKQTIYFDE